MTATVLKKGVRRPMTQEEIAQRRADAEAAAREVRPAYVSALEFRERFTPRERFAIKQAAEAAARNDDFDLFDMWDRVSAAALVDLKDERVANGVRAVESLGLIAAGRADSILAEEPRKPPDDATPGKVRAGPEVGARRE